jgi:hypothetical protein
MEPEFNVWGVRWRNERNIKKSRICYSENVYKHLI